MCRCLFSEGEEGVATYQVYQGRLAGLLGENTKSPTFAPSPTRRVSWIGAAAGESSVAALSQPRPAQSPKALFFPPAESMGRYGAQAGAATQTLEETLVVGGVRACALRAQKYLDRVLIGGDFKDAAYERRREATIVVSCDCVDCADTCFCTQVGGQPYAIDGFDVNLTPLKNGFLAEVATDRGREWVAGGGETELAEATAEQLAERDAVRQSMTRRVEDQNAAVGLSATAESPLDLPNDADGAWQQFAADCVECGACTHICPTCHCFYLYDQALGAEDFERLRTWDSCLLSSYHRMAGGVHMKLSPQPKLSGRLANRVLHKFTYSPQQYGLLGCVGCGRCIDACAGAIDIREVAKELSR